MRSMMRRFHAVFMSLVFIVGGCATIPQDPTDRYSDHQLKEMGRRFLAARDFGQALKYLTVAEKRRPKDAEIQYELGLVYYDRGMRSDAFSHMRRALELKPDYPEVENAFGRFYADQGELDLAQRSFERATGNPFYSTPHLAFFNLGLISEKKGNSEAALRQYQEAVRLQPNYGLAHFRMGQLFEEAGRKDEAREAYARVIEFAPDTAEAYFRYGLLCYNAGEHRIAARSFNRVLQLAPYSSMAENSGKYLELIEEAASASMLAHSPPVRPPGESPSTGLMAGLNLQGKQLALQFPLTEEPMDVDRDGVREPGAGAGAAMPEPPVNKEKEKRPIEEPPSARSDNKTSDFPPVSIAGRLPQSEVTPGQDLDEMLAAGTVAGESSVLSNFAKKVELVQPQTEGRRCYTVRVASFWDKPDAVSVQRQLLKKGVQTSINKVDLRGGGRLYAVELEPVENAELADQLMKQVKKATRAKIRIIERCANQH